MPEEKLRKAACSCRRIELVFSGEPRLVYACSCLECQRNTGSAFAYRAIYPESAIVSRKGEPNSWRRSGSSGQWMEQHFCATCGSLVFMRAETLVDALSVSVGCFEDPDFPAPARLSWAHRKHRWLALEGVPDAPSA
ncbi:GFA family protein [Nitratireductor pacificus]|uniref:Glutathione-dependent formaldehyde-activating protein n=1 Tax=Nitratireductor pacificus pht-3B TaxID=391937 RepID=K2MZG6_9HYPH|nr:GFA family protein [Nitratireductor pacificus]EKF17413.1 glutathione-dependent formaldehyde-activating protein [Nitratireductor pacificus pht-3B]